MSDFKDGWSFALRDATGSHWDDAEIEVTASGGVVNIAVSNEQAVDSYNATFTCSIALPIAQTKELHALLGRFLSDIKACPYFTHPAPRLSGTV